jgi:hypothetical protein
MSVLAQVEPFAENRGVGAILRPYGVPLHRGRLHVPSPATASVPARSEPAHRTQYDLPVIEERGAVAHPLKGEFDLTRARWQGSGRIQVAFVDDLIGMRDGQDPDGQVLVFTEAEWDAFVAGAKDGEFDLPDQL